MSKPNDLFDESAMSFGQHLEVLRVYLIRAIIGWVICTAGTLYYGDELVEYISSPINEALVEYSGHDLELLESLTGEIKTEETAESSEENDTTSESGSTNESESVEEPLEETDKSEEDTSESALENAEPSDTIMATTSVDALAAALHKLDPEKYPLPEDKSDLTVEIPLQADIFKELNRSRQKNKILATVAGQINKPVTHTVHEAFFIYLKVSIVSGFVVASPWIFYQMWLFVAAGLYPQERRYVHFYLPFSIGLFLTGALFCFFFVFPAVLGFLLLFNKSIGAAPMMHMSEWISFALMLPVMFGLSFQLPVVMIVLERISIFTAQDYREKRRISILVIAVLSMLLTPQDPQSMLLMMGPLCLLYELGIVMCQFRVNKPEVTEEI